ncbi:MAG: hypothetical protein ACE5R6_19065 [Candidatus Heimdallarchaeota archaeon]
MISKRKNTATISLCLLSLLVLSITPIYFNGALATQVSTVTAGDALKYKVTRFEVDMTEFNQLPDNPFEIQDPNFLAGSVMYVKILIAESHHLAYAAGFILGEDTTVDIDKRIQFPPELNPGMLPDSIVLEGGAGIPLPLLASYDPTRPFEPYLSPEELPLVIDPTVNWEVITDDLIRNYDPTNAEFVDGQLKATWEHELASDEEGIERASIIWDQNQGGILIEADVEGQQEINGKVSPISMKITFWEKEEYRLPADVGIYFEEQYILSDVNIYLDGYEAIPGVSEEQKQAIAGQIAMINGLAGTTAFEITVLDMHGLMYDFDLTLFPTEPSLTTTESGTGIAFGLSIPFLTPDWDFYTSVWGTGNLAIDVVSALISAIAPLPDIDISLLLLELLTSAEQGNRYFGFTLGEDVTGIDPESGITIHTDTTGDGWVAYEDTDPNKGLFNGFKFTVDGRIWTENVPMEQGGDWDISFGGMVKVDRAGIEVPLPTKLEKPQLIPPTVKTEEPPGPGFIPGFDLIAAVAALLGLSVIVARKKRMT